jgi:hypothetical protein
VVAEALLSATAAPQGAAAAPSHPYPYQGHTHTQGAVPHAGQGRVLLAGLLGVGRRAGSRGRQAAPRGRGLVGHMAAPCGTLVGGHLKQQAAASRSRVCSAGWPILSSLEGRLVQQDQHRAYGASNCEMVSPGPQQRAPCTRLNSSTYTTWHGDDACGVKTTQQCTTSWPKSTRAAA